MRRLRRTLTYLLVPHFLPPTTLCHSFRFSQFSPLHFGAVVSFLAISTPAFLTVPLFHVSHFQSIRRSPFPIFGPFLLWPNDWMHQDATWYRGRPEPRRLCGRSPPPKFSAHVYYSYSDFVSTLHSRNWFIQVQV